MDFKQKYIKYKNKYLELKNIQTGGLFTLKDGLYTYFTSNDFLKKKNIVFIPNAKAPSIYEMNNELNKFAYRVKDGSTDLELIIDNTTRAKLYGDNILETAEGFGDFIIVTGTVAAISIDVLMVVLSDGTATPAVAGVDKVVKASAEIAGKLTNEKIKELRDALKQNMTLPIIIKLKNNFDYKSQDSITNVMCCLRAILKFLPKENFKIDTAITIEVNQFRSNKFFEKKDFAVTQ
jgi:hypothetical protein